MPAQKREGGMKLHKKCLQSESYERCLGWAVRINPPLWPDLCKCAEYDCGVFDVLCISYSQKTTAWQWKTFMILKTNVRSHIIYNFVPSKKWRWATVTAELSLFSFNCVHWSLTMVTAMLLFQHNIHGLMMLTDIVQKYRFTLIR